MTTIVWDGETLAVDSQVSFNDVKVARDKAVRLSDGRVLALCGDAGQLRHVASAIERGAAPKEFPKGDYTAVLLGPDGLLVADEGEWSPTGAPYACGSGSMGALTGLLMGLKAKQACDLACKVDLYSSGPVKTYKAKARK